MNSRIFKACPPTEKSMKEISLKIKNKKINFGSKNFKPFLNHD